MSGTSLDQTAKTLVSAMTAINTLVVSVQTQQRTSDEDRQWQDLVREADLIRRETERDQKRQVEDNNRRRDDEQRHQQTILDWKKDADRYQAKLLEVEAKNTKLIRESIAQQQRTQEKYANVTQRREQIINNNSRSQKNNDEHTTYNKNRNSTQNRSESITSSPRKFYNLLYSIYVMAYLPQ